MESIVDNKVWMAQCCQHVFEQREIYYKHAAAGVAVKKT